MNVEIWATVGTIVATLVLLIVPGVVYAWYVLDRWTGDEESYPDVPSKIRA